MASSWERTLENVKFNGFRTVGTVSCRVLTGTLALLSLAQAQARATGKGLGIGMNNPLVSYEDEVMKL